MLENKIIREIEEFGGVWLKHKPIFSIKEDIARIKTCPTTSKKVNNVRVIKINKDALPYLRAYIFTKEYKPVAVFDNLPYEGFEVFIRVTNCIGTDEIKNGDGYYQIDLANAYRKLIKSKFIKCPFRLVFFNADTLLYHLFIPTELVVYLCTRFCGYDLIDRSFWDSVTQYE